MTYVALLRGINVGGRRKVDMKQLKATFERVGMKNVRTYINSGNVIFRSDVNDAAKLAGELSSAIQAEFGFPVPVIVRDVDNIRTLVQALPESSLEGKNARCNVMFLSEHFDNEEILGQLAIKPGIDDVTYIPGAVVWRIDPAGATRSGIKKLFGTDLYANMTIRNTNTVRKLAELMQQQ